MNQRNAQRLLDVATANRESKFAKYFTMHRYGYECGTPACAFGNYSVRKDLQRKFYIRNMDLFYSNGTIADFWDDELVTWFGLTVNESHDLFSPNGCNDAQTPIQAAKYIENFLDNKGWTF